MNVCGSCGGTRISSEVVTLVVYLKGIKRPVPLIPEDGYVVCMSCQAPWRLLDLAVEASPKTKGQTWYLGTVFFEDGTLMCLNSERRHPGGSSQVFPN